MESDTNRRPRATSHSGGLYFFGTHDMLHYQSVRCHVKCAPNSGNRPHRTNVRGLTVGGLGGAALWRYWWFFGRLCLIFCAWCKTCAALCFRRRVLVLSSPTLTLTTLTLTTLTLTTRTSARPALTTLTSAAFSFSIWVATSGVTYGQAPASGGSTPSPPGAAVYFIDIKNGDSLPPKSVIHFGLRGMGVAPAGSDRENSGHHHLLVRSDLPPLDQPIPSDFTHLHFGAGQTEADVSLPPGEHTLQLILGDKRHIPHSPPVMSERIRVRVAETASAHGTPRRHPSAPNANV